MNIIEKYKQQIELNKKNIISKDTEIIKIQDNIKKETLSHQQFFNELKEIKKEIFGIEEEINECKKNILHININKKKYSIFSLFFNNKEKAEKDIILNQREIEIFSKQMKEKNHQKLEILFNISNIEIVILKLEHKYLKLKYEIDLLFENNKLIENQILKSYLEKKITEKESIINQIQSELFETNNNLNKIEHSQEILKRKSENKELTNKLNYTENEDKLFEIIKWANEENIPEEIIPQDINKLINKKSINLTGIHLSRLSKHLYLLINLKELILWNCDLKHLPKDFIYIKNLEKLNLRGNKDLTISNSQYLWLQDFEKKNICYKDNIKVENNDEIIQIQNSNIKTNVKYERYSKPELTVVIFDWIIKELNHLYNIKDIIDNQTLKKRLIDESNNVAEKLIAKQKTDINLTNLFFVKNKEINFIVKNVQFETFNKTLKILTIENNIKDIEPNYENAFKEKIIESNMKLCPHCKKRKKLEEFDKNSNRKDGLVLWCKSCMMKKREKTIKEKELTNQEDLELFNELKEKEIKKDNKINVQSVSDHKELDIFDDLF